MPSAEDGRLDQLVDQVFAAAPCSMEMPAGTGKTHLLAAAVARAATQGKRSLVLTHTNAGVDALRNRLKAFGVSPRLVRVDTITSWAFTLVRSYGQLAGLTVPKIPDWSDSSSYVDAASRVAGSAAIGGMHAASFDHFFVDEYQDCNVRQHQLVCVISDSIPSTIVFGDRLQGIFGFAGERLVDWPSDVFSRFPLLDVQHSPHRWQTSNPRLGAWLIGIRPAMRDGQFLDFANPGVPGVNWVKAGDGAVASAAHGFRDFTETVVLLDKWPNDVASHASRLGGSYSVMEDIRGNFMIKELETLPPRDSHLVARWLATFAKNCIVGLAGLDAVVLGRLYKNESITHYKRDGIDDVLTALERLQQKPSYAGIVEAASIISHNPGLKIYRWEAWRDTLEAIRSSDESGAQPLEAFAAVRDRLRRSGRRATSRIASRTLLVKGLEYDHVIISDLGKLRDPRNLYVALTRAKKSVTIIGASSRIRLQDGS